MMDQAISFQVIYLKENGGHGNARRASLQNCRNELVALMDADDVSLPGRFEKQLERFRNNLCLSAVGGQIAEFFGAPDNISGIRRVPLGHAEICWFMRKRCPMNQVSVMVKKQEVEKVGGYMDWYCNEDYYLWLRMMRAGCVFANLPDILVSVRAGADMATRRGGLKYFRSEKRLQEYMLREHIIGLPGYLYNVSVRFGGEVLAGNWLRSRLFRLVRADISNEEKKMISYERAASAEKAKGQYPPFSVAMSVYGKDNAEWFDMALASVIDQTVQPDEIVLVVDGPVPDSIKKVIDKYSGMKNMQGQTVRKPSSQNSKP